MKRSLWAITSYFNPFGYKRRLENYLVFRKFLGVPLLTVEWSPTGEFQLQKGDADCVVQVSGGNVMWQKERLLNIALENLPVDCDLVAWLDCDIVFACSDWPMRAREKLDRFAAVQLFKKVLYAPASLTPGQVSPEALGTVESTLTGESLACQLTGESRRVQEIERQFNGQNDGLAWAASRKLMQKHGFYDARIVGGGGMGIAKASWGNYMEYVQERSLTPSQTAHYLDWAIPYHETVKASITFIEGDIYHLWHGDLSNRQYRMRQRMLNEYDYDPYTDIAMDESGCWRWNNDKPELHRYVSSYLEGRKEDGLESR